MKLARIQFQIASLVLIISCLREILVLHADRDSMNRMGDVSLVIRTVLTVQARNLIAHSVRAVVTYARINASHAILASSLIERFARAVI